ncbi:esterase/lipase family protein [Virgibacillus soli]|uniref:esterase/lipase family protein n=1 Tax=Paracerasibacillus soli TaxID=480284 RepID=UPI0035E732B7
MLLKRIVSVTLFVFMMLTVSTSFASANTMYAPVPSASQDNTLLGKVGNGNDETPGEWTLGETPPHLKQEAPILLFVPGLNNVAQIWWEVENSMAEAVYDAGYQAAFIQLHDAGGASADMWDNGQLLAEKIREISAHFNGKPITIVAYSKGGVDTQTALTYYGVSHLVNNVITLSSPHHGSQLANLAYSAGASWLADLIGAKGDGTYAMQTGYMENFRLETDQEAQAYANNFYTLGGTGWGTVFSANWFGGVYLSTYGQNDGVVTVNSSRLPGGQELAVENWSHTNIRTGITLPIFEDYLASEQTNHVFDMIDRNDSVMKVPANRWITGAPLKGGKLEQIPITVEEKVEQLKFTLLTASPLANVSILDPHHKQEKLKVDTLKSKDEFFTGAYIHSFTIEKPVSGEWQLQLESKDENAYLLLADYDATSKLHTQTRTKEQLSKLHATNQFFYEIEHDAAVVQTDSLQATYHITNTKNPQSTQTITATGKDALSQYLTFTQHDTVYSITIEIEGKTKAGELFKRTMVDSIYHP